MTTAAVPSGIVEGTVKPSIRSIGEEPLSRVFGTLENGGKEVAGVDLFGVIPRPNRSHLDKQRKSLTLASKGLSAIPSKSCGPSPEEVVEGCQGFEFVQHLERLWKEFGPF